MDGNTVYTLAKSGYPKLATKKNIEYALMSMFFLVAGLG